MWRNPVRGFGRGLCRRQEVFSRADITASELCRLAQSLAKHYGGEYGGPIAGHLIGPFPHEKIVGDEVTLYVHPDSHLPMRAPDENGQSRHWILEIHFVDRERQIGGFYEELLTVDPQAAIDEPLRDGEI